ncbi:glycosyltransferase [Leptolyngbya sp. PL-A3]
MVTALSYLLDEVLPNAYELIVVDDNSPDQTWNVALQLIHHYPALRVIRRMEERGLATAVVRGWEAAQGEILGVIDTDLQQPPEVLLELVKRMQQGADLAIASRNAQGGGSRNLSPARRLLRFGARLLGRLILPNVVGRVSDPMSGYFLVRREAIAGRVLFPSGYKILLEVLSRGDIQNIAEVGYVFHGRPDKRKHSFGSKVIGYLRHLMQLRQSLETL